MVDTIAIDLMPDDTCMKEVLFWRSFFPEVEIATMDLGRFIDSKDWASHLNKSKKWQLNVAVRLGYYAREINMIERNNHLQDIWEVNTSTANRQGRPMDAHYKKYPSKMTDNAKSCLHHLTRFFVVYSSEGRVVGYVNLHICGNMAAISQLLGHAYHMRKAGIMVLLLQYIIDYLKLIGVRFLTYHHWKGGTEGLQLWKKLMLFEPKYIQC